MHTLLKNSEGHGSVVRRGRSKELRTWSPGVVSVRMLPTLRSITHDREEVVSGTASLRLDFFEEASRVLSAADVNCAFIKRTGRETYLSRWCADPPIEVIVKMEVIGSVLRDYPGLFVRGYRFGRPVVRFDYRSEPRDMPLPEDYVREMGEDPVAMRSLALSAAVALQAWFGSRFELVDICFIMGRDASGQYCITSEVSPDGMRLRDSSGRSRDKDLFRIGASHETIINDWRLLIEELRAGSGFTGSNTVGDGAYGEC